MLIRAENLCKTYAHRKGVVNVLRGVDMAVEQGETVAVVGRSGAGKSTLLHILGGLDRPDGGRVLLDGEDLYGLSAGRRTQRRATRIGFVFQSYHLLPEMDVTENVMLPAMARSRLAMPGARIRARAVALLDAVGLGERGDHTSMELSGGEQQRVALARALMNEPDIVLADEPTGNLDERTGEQVLDYLFDIVRRQRRALVLVTHNETVAGKCDRILQLRDGTVAAGA